MRLTLRTMLAHMDGILEPEDDEDIRKKISESEFATNLMHRIRDAMRRLRLGAPGLGGRGPGLDPNTVAEYLDNALHDDQVADFEKVCLESDMQLAEVAAAHQILALVLGEPVEIDPAARQRMYGLPEAAVEAQKAAEFRRREKPGVPEYLREPPKKRRILRAVAVVGLAGCGLVAILAATGGLNSWLEWAGFRPLGPETAVRAPVPDSPLDVAESTEPASDEEDTASLEVAPDSGLDNEAAEAETETAQQLPPAGVPPAEPSEEPAQQQLPEPQEEPSGSAPLPLPADDPREPAPLPDDVPSAPMPTDIPEVGSEPGLPLGDEGSEVPEPEVEMELVPADGAPQPPRDPAPLPEGPIPGIQEPPSPADPAPLPEEGATPTSLGRLASDRQLLLQSDPTKGVWERVAMQTAIRPKFPLLALPTYRPVVALSAGVTVQLVGPAQVELDPHDDGAVPMLELAYGRLTMHTLGQAGSRMRLAFGDRSGTITFAQADSGVAVHVYRQATPGNDPEKQVAPLVAHLWATRGNIVWQTDGGQPVNVGTSSRILLGSGAPEPPEPKAAGSPAWITDDSSSLLDKRASAVLVEEIEVDRPVALALRELAVGHRQREVRWLAVRCLGYLGQFDSMVAVLDQEDSKTVWFDYLEELRAAMNRDPRLAAAVRESLQRLYPADAEKLYRLLRGYSDADLRDNAAASLVDDLEHERLAVRLLSFWNLREITGLGLFYRPEYPAGKRQQPVQRWRERLAAGEIVRSDGSTSGRE